MSSHDAPDCPICGAHSDYCHLETASCISIDCRNLMLRNPEDLAWNIELAKAIHGTDDATEGES